MGIFDKTPEEIKKIEEQRNLYKLETSIRNSNILKPEVAKILTNYINDIRNNKIKNDYFDLDFLSRVFINLIDKKFDSIELMNNQLRNIKMAINYLLPAATTTPNYDFIKEMIINNFVGSDGFIYNNLFNPEFYSLFEDKVVYLNIMNIIRNNDLENDMKHIEEYAKKVKKYCLSYDMFYNDIISFVTGIKDVKEMTIETPFYKMEDIMKEYYHECLEIAKKRVGIYSLSPKDLALCNDNIERIEAYMEQNEKYEKSLEDSREEIKVLIDNGIKNINNTKNKLTKELKKIVFKEKEELLHKLDDYLLEIEKSLKEKSDLVFQDILATYQKQIRDFRTMFQGYSKATAQDLLKIQKATEASIKELQDYVTNDEHLKELLENINTENSIREKIIKLVATEEVTDRENTVAIAENNQKVNTVVIPGYDKLIVPATPEVIIPTASDKKEISYFDDTVSFNLRIEKILKNMEERENQGEFFHQKTEQIIRDIIEGDWPYLYGPSGGGKSHIMQQVAELLGMELLKNGKITEPYTVMGYNDPQGRFRATQTFIAVMYGKLLAFDEFDNGNPDTQVILNEIYSGLLDTLEDPTKKKYITFAEDMSIPINPNFRMISAGNTSGEGENAVFSSRAKIDESVQERMTPIYIDYDKRVEEKIFGNNTEWYKFFESFRNACNRYALNNGLETAPGIGTTRDASAICKYIRNNSKTLDQVLEEKFVQTKNSEYREELGRYIANAYNINYDNIQDIYVDTPLKDIKVKTIAKKFIYKCKEGIK